MALNSNLNWNAPQFSRSSHHIWEGIGALRYHFHCSTRSIPEHNHASHALFISLGGSTWLNMPANGYNQLQRLPVGGIAITPAHVMHSAVVEQPSEFMILYLHPGFVHSGDLPTRGELKPTIVESDPLVQAISTALNMEDVDLLYAETLFQALSAHLLKRYSSHSESCRLLSPSHTGLSALKLGQVRDYIEAHLQDAIRLEDLAGTVSLSRYHFCRLFKQSVGTSPYQYILQQRVEKARQLLRRQELSLVDVALASGFASQSHFSRHFHQQVGVTPKVYRQKLRI